MNISIYKVFVTVGDKIELSEEYMTAKAALNRYQALKNNSFFLSDDDIHIVQLTGCECLDLDLLKEG